MNKNIRNIKLTFWTAGGALFVHLMCSSKSLAGFFLWLALSALSAFVVFADTKTPLFSIGGGAMLAAGGLTGGVNGMLITLLLVLVPVLVQASVMRTKFLFDVSTVSAVGLFSAGVMVIDRYFVKISGYGVYDRFCDFIDAAIETAELTGTKAFAPAEAEEISMLFSAVGDGIKLMFPGFVIIIGMLIFSAVLIIIGKYIIPFSNPPKLSELRLNRRLYTVYCALYILSAFITAMPLSAFLYNVNIVLTVLVMICGFSVILYYTRKIPSRALANAVFLFAVPVCLTVTVIPIAAGVIDGIMDLRRKK